MSYFICPLPKSSCFLYISCVSQRLWKKIHPLSSPTPAALFSSLQLSLLVERLLIFQIHIWAKIKFALYKSFLSIQSWGETCSGGRILRMTPLILAFVQFPTFAVWLEPVNLWWDVTLTNRLHYMTEGRLFRFASSNPTPLKAVCFSS